MEACWRWALRGHEVLLYERAGELGGQLLVGRRAPTRKSSTGCSRTCAGDSRRRARTWSSTARSLLHFTNEATRDSLSCLTTWPLVRDRSSAVVAPNARDAVRIVFVGHRPRTATTVEPTDAAQAGTGSGAAEPLILVHAASSWDWERIAGSPSILACA